MKRCKALTRNGLRCKRFAMVAGFCVYHYRREYGHDVKKRKRPVDNAIYLGGKK